MLRYTVCRVLHGLVALVLVCFKILGNKLHTAAKIAEVSETVNKVEQKGKLLKTNF